MKLEDIVIDLTEEAIEYFQKKADNTAGIVISYNEIMNWCGSHGEWISVTVQSMKSYDQEQYFKIDKDGIAIYFQYDAYFMMSGLSKLTIDLMRSSHGEFLVINELFPTVT